VFLLNYTISIVGAGIFVQGAVIGSSKRDLDSFPAPATPINRKESKNAE
jgi:hypothetical protein